jgi:hypothetical protein
MTGTPAGRKCFELIEDPNGPVAARLAMFSTFT